MSVFPGIKAERRIHPRHALRTHALVVLGDGRQIEARTLAIGRGGMANVAGINPPAGSTFTVRVTPPIHPKGHAPFEAQVRVADCVLDGAEGGFRLGVEFQALDALARAVLKRVFG